MSRQQLSRKQVSKWGWCLAVAGSLSSSLATVSAADAPSPQQALALKPLLAAIEYEIPAEAQVSKCKVTLEKGTVGGANILTWLVTGPQGQVLRRFVDSNQDDFVDQWRYYKDGVEVYREFDSNFNKKVDQMRCFNNAGSRWGIDANEDGKIDTWKAISAEELSREVVQSLVKGDSRRLSVLFTTQTDLDALGLKGEPAETILKNFADADSKIREIQSSSKGLSDQTQWLQFDGAIPSIVPQEQLKTTADLLIQPNVMAVTEQDGKTGLIQLGTLLKVGEAWRLTRLPQVLEGNSIQIAEETLFLPQLVASANDGQPVIPMSDNPKLQKLIEDLQAHDKASPRPDAGREAWSRFNIQRIELLARISAACDTDDERGAWIKQIADSLASGVQTDTLSNGLAELRKLETEIRRKSPKSDLLPYVVYRTLTAEYNVELQKATSNDKSSEIIDRWLKKLEKFVSDYPQAEDLPEAMFQLASTQELGGKLKEARTWYKRLADTGVKHQAVTRAEGAIRRFESKGEKFALSGKLMNGQEFSPEAYKGKVLLVIYWANWCRPCVEDLPLLRAAYDQYHDQGLEIVGVSVDNSTEEAQAWLSQHKISWPQLFEPGGLETSPVAIQYGVVSTPTMFVVDRDGLVAHRGSSAEDLKSILTELFRSK